MRQSLVDLRGLVAHFAAGPLLPPEDRNPARVMLERLRRLSGRPPGPRQVGGVEAALREVRAAVAAGRPLLTLPAPTLRKAAWTLWTPDGGQAEAIPGFLDAAFRLAQADDRMLKRLALVWLSGFDFEKPATEAGKRIGSLLAGSSSRLLGGWRAAQDRFVLFDAGRGPTLVAQKVLAEGDSAIAEASLDMPLLAKGGYMRAVTIALAAEVGRRLAKPGGAALLDRAEAFLVSGRALRFAEPELRGRLADGLVSAWRGTPTPTDALRSRVLAFLREHLGDPRVNKQHWQRASAETQKTIRSWLAAVTLDAFFRTIGRFSMQAGLEHQWADREAFWRACLRKNFIQDSWVVVGDNVQHHIRGIRDIAGSYGLTQGGADPNHSVLLLTIGQHVFAEWSHNGKLRVWRHDDPRAPRLFNSGYYPVWQLKGLGLSFPAPLYRGNLDPTGPDGLVHNAATWRQRVAEFLRLNEGLIIEEHEWLPRR